MSAPAPHAAAVALVGPVLPYRGGIAHYTTSLHRTLLANGQLATTYSFSRQYPAWLYPGNEDTDPDRRDHREPGVHYRIDSVNPLTWWRAAREIADSAPELVVFPWWTVFWGPCFAIMIAVLKRHRRRVAFICHNLVDHESSAVKAAISWFVLGRADAYITHSSDHAAILQRRFPHRPVIHHCHPAYAHYPTATGVKPKRGKLELLFFGFIRPYKGLDVLLDAMEQLDGAEVFLTVVGEPWGDVDRLRSRMAAMPNVETHLGYAADAEVAEYFARADFVVLPYRAATGSGVAALAFQYDTPIIATRVGGLADVVSDGETGILIEPNDASALRTAIRGVNRDTARTLAGGLQRFKRSDDWGSLAAALGSLA